LLASENNSQIRLNPRASLTQNEQAKESFFKHAPIFAWGGVLFAIIVGTAGGVAFIKWIEEAIDHNLAMEQTTSRQTARAQVGDEVPACNSAIGKDLILASFEKMKQAVVEAVPESSDLMGQWQMDLRNIRQTKYDDKFDIRYCTADFVFNNSPPDMTVLAWLVPRFPGGFKKFLFPELG
jgi:hypothetical protein